MPGWKLSIIPILLVMVAPEVHAADRLTEVCSTLGKHGILPCPVTYLFTDDRHLSAMEIDAFNRTAEVAYRNGKLYRAALCGDDHCEHFIDNQSGVVIYETSGALKKDWPLLDQAVLSVIGRMPD